MPKLQQQIPVEAQEEALERIGQQTVERNADLRSKGLVGNNTVAVKRFPDQAALLAVAARSRFRGRPVSVARRPAARRRRARALEPGRDHRTRRDRRRSSQLAPHQRGGGRYERDEVRSVQNLMISIERLAARNRAARRGQGEQRTSISRRISRRLTTAASQAQRSTVLRIIRPRIHPSSASMPGATWSPSFTTFKSKSPLRERSQGGRRRCGRQDLPDQDSAS